MTVRLRTRFCNITKDLENDQPDDRYQFDATDLVMQCLAMATMFVFILHALFVSHDTSVIPVIILSCCMRGSVYLVLVSSYFITYALHAYSCAWGIRIDISEIFGARRTCELETSVVLYVTYTTIMLFVKCILRA